MDEFRRGWNSLKFVPAQDLDPGLESQLNHYIFLVNEPLNNIIPVINIIDFSGANILQGGF